MQDLIELDAALIVIDACAPNEHLLLVADHKQTAGIAELDSVSVLPARLR